MPMFPIHVSVPVLVVTVPSPVPAFVTVRGYVLLRTKPATMFRAAVMVTVQAPVPVHPSPDQPVNVEPAAAVAVKVTCVPYTV
jgi:hypothetical protein